MIAGVEGTFQRLGEVDPYWAVLTDDRFKSEHIEKTRGEFYATGANGIQTVFRSLERNGGIANLKATCFELGCGVGRSTIYLAEKFARVIAADVSLPHLAVTRQAAQLYGRSNIETHHVGKISELDALPEFDFFFTVIVLQHNPPPVIAMLLRKLLSKLKPGGMAYFQVPTYIPGYKFNVESYLARPVSGIEVHCLPQKKLFRILEQTGCELLEFREDTAAGGDKSTILSNTVIARRIS
jgi:SAM-dependent methyltransferase